MAVILFDTNIFIDLFNGAHQAAVELGHYDYPAVSVITYMELQAGLAVRPNERVVLDALLADFRVLQLDQQVMEQAIEIRGNSLITGPKVKMPDAIIGATARAYGIPIVTRNPKDFNWDGIKVHIPYDYDSSTGIVTNIRAPYPVKTGRPTITRIR